jgi:hypothetical protein
VKFTHARGNPLVYGHPVDVQAKGYFDENRIIVVYTVAYKV